MYLLADSNQQNKLRRVFLLLIYKGLVNAAKVSSQTKITVNYSNNEFKKRPLISSVRRPSLDSNYGQRCCLFYPTQSSSVSKSGFSPVCTRNTASATGKSRLSSVLCL